MSGKWRPAPATFSACRTPRFWKPVESGTRDARLGKFRVPTAARERSGGRPRAQRKRRNIHRNWRHHVSRRLASSAGMVVFEKLNIPGMTKSARGTVDNPGKNVKAKAGLNRVILETGWGELQQMTEYKAHSVEKVNPAYTSQTCNSCGVVDAKSRKSQALFACGHCGWRGNADHNAALNVLARGKGATGRGWAIALATQANRQPNCLEVRDAA